MWVLIVRDPGSDNDPAIRLAEGKGRIEGALRDIAVRTVQETIEGEGQDFGLKKFQGDVPTMASHQVAEFLHHRFGYVVSMVERQVLS